METRAHLASEKKRKKREVQVREHVITLVKYLDTVIHDIKYVVGDLQVLLEQIDLVSRQLDQSAQPSPSSEGKFGGSQGHTRCSCSQLQASGKLTNPLLARAKRVSPGSKKTKRSSKSRRVIEEDNSSSASSLGSWTRSDQRHKDNVMELDAVSVEMNSMWDNAFDNELLATSWTEQKTNENLDYLVKSTKFPCIEKEQEVLAKRSSWFNGKLEQSLTSGIEMLSFTDDSDEDYLSSALPIYDTKYGSVHKEFVVSVDPYHVCCKDVIPLGSDHVYCGVYEAMLDASLEPYSGMVESESFGSDIPLFWGEPDADDVTAMYYEPTYDTQLNTWTAYTMVALDSINTSEEELSETALDILNDNIPSSTQIDNINTVNDNTETLSTEGDIRHMNTYTGAEISTNTYIIRY